MAEFRRIPIFFNDSGEQTDETGRSLKNTVPPKLIFGETVILCVIFQRITFIDNIPTATVINLDSSAAFACFGAAGSFGDTLMFLAENFQINAPGDWFENQQANPEAGQLSFRVSTNTINFSAALSNRDSRSGKMVITAIPAGESDCTVLALCDFQAQNRPIIHGNIPEEIESEYYTSAQVRALFSAGFELEFAPVAEGAGSTSSVRRVGDKFYRFKLRSISGAAWSGWIELFNGRSAYECWLDAGNTGDSSVFFSSLTPPPPKDVKINFNKLVNFIFTATAAELGLNRAAAVQVYDDDGKLMDSSCGVVISWSNTDILTVDFTDALEAYGTWTLRFAGGSNLSLQISDAAAVPVNMIPGLGYVHVLGEETRSVHLLHNAENMAKLHLKIRAEVGSGNAVLNIKLNNLLLASKTVELTSSPTAIDFEFASPVNGLISICREVESDEDTLEESLYILNIKTELRL